jgi:hypothetical protein
LTLSGGRKGGLGGIPPACPFRKQTNTIGFSKNEKIFRGADYGARRDYSFLCYYMLFASIFNSKHNNKHTLDFFPQAW